MFKLLKILLFLHVISFRRKLQLLGALFAIATALQIHIMPDWLVSLIGSVTGTTTAPAANREREPSQAASGALGGLASWLIGSDGGTDTRTSPALPSPQQPQRYAPPVAPSPKPVDMTRGQLFAAYANLPLRKEQIAALPDSPAPVSGAPANVRWRRIDRVLDGNTLVIDGQVVRLIGIDAPESEENDLLFAELERVGARGQARDMMALGKLAARFLKQAEGRRCWLEYERQTRDQAGRILAYAHLDDGTNLNEVVLYQGFAKVHLGAGFRYMKRFIYLQHESMNNRNGLWGER